MITFKLIVAIITFILSSGQIILQTFQHHHIVNPKHGAIKFMIFTLSSLSFIYLAKDIYSDFDNEKNTPVSTASIPSPMEQEYWHTLYSNPNPEGYCAYLEKYPQGQFAAIAKTRIPNGDCLQVKRQAENELRVKAEAELKEKLEHEAKLLAEEKLKLEAEAQANAELKNRVDILEATQMTTELKSPGELSLKTPELELKKPSEVLTNTSLETELKTEEENTSFDAEIKAKTEKEEAIF